MWKSGVVSLIVIALWACVATAGQSEPGTPADAVIAGVDTPAGLTLQATADPSQTWDPAAHLFGSWTSVTLTSRTDRTSDVPVRSLAIASSFTISDPNGLLGLTQTPTGILALDQYAKVFYSAATARDRFYITPMSLKKIVAGQWVSELLPYSFTISMPLDPNRMCPVMVTRLEWSTYALIAGAIKNVDIPFKASDKWVDVTPNYQVLVEKADVTATSYQYSLKVKYNPSKVSTSSSVFLVGDQKPPEAIISKVEVLNAQGKPIQDQANGGSFGSSSASGGTSTEATGANSGNGTCNICGTAATIRYTVILNPYEKEIRFLLQNIPIPALWY